MSEIPDSTNFASSIYTTYSMLQVAKLFRKAGWDVDRANDHQARELSCEWADLIIQESHPVINNGPILVSGCVADVETNAGRIVEILRKAGRVSYEGYGPDDTLLFEREA